MIIYIPIRPSEVETSFLDQLLHRATVINIRGENYRLKEKRQAGAALVEAINGKGTTPKSASAKKRSAANQ